MPRRHTYVHRKKERPGKKSPSIVFERDEGDEDEGSQSEKELHVTISAVTAATSTSSEQQKQPKKGLLIASSPKIDSSAPAVTRKESQFLYIQVIRRNHITCTRILYFSTMYTLRVYVCILNLKTYEYK